MSKCVLDTSICVDLWSAGILENALRLPHDFLLPDVIAEECKEPPGEYLKSLDIVSVSLEAEHIDSVAILVEQYGQPSLSDLFALTYAKAHVHMLLTGDGPLRAAAENEGVEVHGVIWIVDAMVQQNILSPADAATALERMIEAGSWLPRDECQDRIRRWRE